MIAALFVETGGCYFNLPDVDPWDETRDARKYAGPWPIIAHPPCQLWGPFAAINYKRFQQAYTAEHEDAPVVAITKEQAGMVAKWILEAAKSIVDEP